MNKHEATELGIRLIAILNLTTLVSTIPALLSVINVAVNNDSDFPYDRRITSLFGIVMPVLISLILWFNANAISRWIWRKSQTIEDEKSPTATQIQVVLFTSIGLYLFVSALPDMFKFFLYWVQKLAGDSPFEFNSLSDYAFAVGYVIQVVLSAWLILDSDGIVRGLQARKRRRAK
jgi:hypothetical protein